MRTQTVKQDNKAAVDRFLAAGGKITKIPTVQKPKRTREVRVVEIDIEHLPKELHKYLPEAA